MVLISNKEGRNKFLQTDRLHNIMSSAIQRMRKLAPDQVKFFSNAPTKCARATSNPERIPQPPTTGDPGHTSPNDPIGQETSLPPAHTHHSRLRRPIYSADPVVVTPTHTPSPSRAMWRNNHRLRGILQGRPCSCIIHVV